MGKIINSKKKFYRKINHLEKFTVKKITVRKFLNKKMISVKKIMLEKYQSINGEKSIKKFSSIFNILPKTHIKNSCEKETFIHKLKLKTYQTSTIDHATNGSI